MDAMSDMPSAERKITVRTKRFHGLAEATIFDAGSQVSEGEAPPTGERFATVNLSASQFAAPIERPAEGIADFLETVATAIVEVSSLSSNQHSWQNNARFNRTLEREGSVGSSR